MSMSIADAVIAAGTSVEGWEVAKSLPQQKLVRFVTNHSSKITVNYWYSLKKTCGVVIRGEQHFRYGVSLRDLKEALGDPFKFFEVSPTQTDSEMKDSQPISKPTRRTRLSERLRAPQSMPTPKRPKIEPKSAPNTEALSKEQQAVLETVLEGNSIFFTGAAGTGKSHVLLKAIRDLRRKHMDNSLAVAVTASTGTAAVKIGGSTLHSFAGVGLATGNLQKIIGMAHNRASRERLEQARVLIIDEVSMIDAAFFEKLDAVARSVRMRYDEPFGGLQVIATGDFFQLPPVHKRTRTGEVVSEPTQRPAGFTDRDMAIQALAGEFVFQSPAWKALMKREILLTEVFRQEDASFVSMLNELRKGRPTPKILTELREHKRDEHAQASKQAETTLFPLRRQALYHNREQLRALKSESVRFTATDWVGDKDPNRFRKMLDDLIVEKEVDLKVGATVMLLRNLDVKAGLCNGTTGRVVEFCFVVEDEKSKKKGSKEARKISPKGPNGERNAVVVEFKVHSGQYVRRTLAATRYDVEEYGVLRAWRMQVPLMLAFASTIHKVQGMTLDFATVRLEECFEKGQAYVALSRLRNLSGLKIEGEVHARMFVVSDAVVQFYNKLEGENKDHDLGSGSDTEIEE